MVSEVKRRGVQESKDIDYAKQHHTPHCWLPAKLKHPANSTKRFSWLTRSTSTLLMKNFQIYNITKDTDKPVDHIPQYKNQADKHPYTH